MQKYQKPLLTSTQLRPGATTESIVAVAVVVVALYGAAATVGAVALAAVNVAGAANWVGAYNWVS